MKAPPLSQGAFDRLAIQLCGLAMAVFVVGAWHWPNDGLWFQGDAPRHAANGFFFWDLLTSLPTNPLKFALSYYARYPVIAPGAYPPFLYVLEGAAFWAIAPSPFVAKCVVLAFAGLLGIYVMTWGRRWIAPFAGWAGVFVVLMPGVVRFSNAVLPNVPATALAFAALYHFRVWQETAETRQIKIFCLFAAATVLTYFPAVTILPVALVWSLRNSKAGRSKVVWLISGALFLLIILVAATLPVYVSRHLPSVQQFFRPWRWAIFAQRLSGLTGLAWLGIGAAGATVAFFKRPHKTEVNVMLSAYATITIGLLAIRWADARYALALVPLTVLSAFLGLNSLVEHAGRARTLIVGAVMGLLMVLTLWRAQATLIPEVSGFEEIADYLRREGPSDSILYQGYYDGVLGFYIRAKDPYFERGLMLWRKLVAETNKHAGAPSAQEIVKMVQSESGCRWIAIEESTARGRPVDSPLREALRSSDFELVASFPIRASGISAVNLYRFNLPLMPAPTRDLSFLGFSGRVFRDVPRIASRR